MVKAHKRTLVVLLAATFASFAVFAFLTGESAFSKAPDLPTWQTPGSGQAGSPANVGPSEPPTPYDNCCDDCDSDFDWCAGGGVLSCFLGGGPWCMATLDLCGVRLFLCYENCEVKFILIPTGPGSETTAPATTSTPVRHCRNKGECGADEFCYQNVCEKPLQ